MVFLLGCLNGGFLSCSLFASPALGTSLPSPEEEDKLTLEFTGKPLEGLSGLRRSLGTLFGHPPPKPTIEKSKGPHSHAKGDNGARNGIPPRYRTPFPIHAQVCVFPSFGMSNTFWEGHLELSTSLDW